MLDILQCNMVQSNDALHQCPNRAGRPKFNMLASKAIVFKAGSRLQSKLQNAILIGTCDDKG